MEEVTGSRRRTNNRSSSTSNTHLAWKAFLNKPNPVPIPLPYDVSYSLYAEWAHLLILYLLKCSQIHFKSLLMCVFLFK